MKNSARFLFIFFLLSIFFLLFSKTSVRASTPSPSNESHLYTQQVLLDLSSALTCQLAGIDPSGLDPQTGQPKKCLSYDLNGKLGFLPNPALNGTGQTGGTIGFMGNLIAVLYTPPASTGDYFQYLTRNFGVVRPAYARGIGFEGLAPLLPVWIIFRNMAYLFFIIIFIITGLAVMLRIHIDPRTVMTIQNQIPKLIITLILITFSYAIAGFLIDVMYLTIYLLLNITALANPGIKGALSSISRVQGENVFGFANSIPFEEVGGIVSIIGSASGAIGGIVRGLFSPSGSNFISDPITSTIGLVLGGIANVLAFLIVAIAVLWALFRLWFELLKAYVFILVDVLFSPLWLLTGIMPGGMGVGPWLRDITGNLSSFPTTIGMFLIGKIFMDAIENGGPNTFVPPLIGNPSAGESQKYLASLIGLGIILLTPDVVNMVKKVFKAPVFPLAPIIQALGVGAGTASGTIKQTAGTMFVAMKGTFPQTGEKGTSAIFRRMFGRM